MCISHIFHFFNFKYKVTPAELITGGLITEFGLFKPEELEPKLKPLIKF